jgi:hypothetical protein
MGIALALLGVLYLPLPLGIVAFFVIVVLGAAGFGPF